MHSFVPVLELISLLLLGQDMDQDPINNPPGQWSANQGQPGFAENAAAPLGGVTQVRPYPSTPRMKPDEKASSLKTV